MSFSILLSDFHFINNFGDSYNTFIEIICFDNELFISIINNQFLI